MPRYLSPRKAAKHKETIEKFARILAASKYESFILDGPPASLYDDLWTIRAILFPSHTHRFRFKKQFNGVWVEISPPFNTSNTVDSIDMWDGETVEQELTRGMIATKLIMDKPSKIRFSMSPLSEKDVDKLTVLATNNSYATLATDKWLSFTHIPPVETNE